MADKQDNTFDIRIKLKMIDYFRYYFSLLNLKLSGLIINILSIVIILLYSLSLISLVYIASTTGVFTWKTGKGVLIDLAVIFLFSTPFIRTYLIAYKDAKTHKFLDKEINVTITGDSFIVSKESTRLEYSWKKMFRIMEFYHGFALFIDKKDLTFVLPKRYFSNKQQIEMLRGIIKKYKK